jgi:hypothetical protein
LCFACTWIDFTGVRLLRGEDIGFGKGLLLGAIMANLVKPTAWKRVLVQIKKPFAVPVMTTFLAMVMVHYGDDVLISTVKHLAHLSSHLGWSTFATE